ncbi:MAG TPA: hypothetical protein VHC93_16585 [Methylomirabilota bacterium]|jgi:hypothetical protein|nr:hypothetical protein [Methylomirabilota bacterium]
MRLMQALVMITMLWMPHPTAALDDAELISQLVAGSPWKGENVGDRGLGSVTYDVVFNKDSTGGLTGLVSNYSIPAFAKIANGPMKTPSVRNGVLRFETNRGSYELRPSSDGKWTGSALSLDKTFGATVTLTPAAK